MEPVLLVERYELSELLGAGGMAEVYLGRDRELDRPVAIKLVASGDRDSGHVERLRREARAIASLRHPGVVAVHDIGVSGGKVFVVMEYLEGETVGELIARRGPLPVATAARVAAEACEALSAAHARDVVHRDVSPGNLMICSDKHVKVLDFGIALVAHAGSGTETGTVLGTPAYLSPEQARGETLDARSDVYSLGCCLYEMTTGQRPFTGSTPAAFAYQHVNEEPRAPRAVNPAITAEMESVIRRAMAKDPEDRYASAAVMAADLAEMGAEPATVPATPAGAAGTRQRDEGDTERIGRTTPVRRADSDARELDGSHGMWRKRLGLALIAIAVAAIVVVCVGLLLQGP